MMVARPAQENRTTHPNARREKPLERLSASLAPTPLASRPRSAQDRHAQSRLPRCPRLSASPNGRPHGHRLVSEAARHPRYLRSEEHTSELQSLMRISYAVFCLKKKTTSARKKKQHINYN